MARVVVVDDDADIRHLVSLKLVNAGYDVTEAADGHAGLATVLETQPDVVVLDWMMPGLTGIEVCQALRHDPRTIHTSVLMLSAKAQQHDAEAGYAAGADDYLLKPFSGRELVNRVHTLATHTH